MVLSKHLLRGTGQLIWVLVLSLTLTFATLRLLPGDAVEAQLALGGGSREAVEARRAVLGLDQPLHQQYFDYLGGLVHGDLGYSWVSGLAVSDLIRDRIGPTVALAFWSLLLAVPLGLGLGWAEAGSGWAASLARWTIALGQGMPLVLTGTLAIVIVAANVPALPGGGTGGPRYLFLPVAVLALHVAAPIARVAAARLRVVRYSQHVIVARSRGLPPSWVAGRHIWRVILPDLLPLIALQAGFLLGGVVVTETLFLRPGMGRLMVDSVLQGDYPTVQALVLLAALAFATLQFAADLLQTWLDPRL